MSKMNTGDAPLYHEIHGKGRPLLLIAGLGSDNSSWVGVVRMFSRRFKTIIFETF